MFREYFTGDSREESKIAQTLVRICGREKFSLDVLILTLISTIISTIYISPASSTLDVLNYAKTHFIICQSIRNNEY